MQLLQDYILFIVVGVLVAIDVVFLIFVTAFPSARLAVEDIEIQSNVKKQGVFV